MLCCPSDVAADRRMQCIYILYCFTTRYESATRFRGRQALSGQVHRLMNEIIYRVEAFGKRILVNTSSQCFSVRSGGTPSTWQTRLSPALHS